jgi:hypothetical protein
MKWKRFLIKIMVFIAILYALLFIFINYIRPLDYLKCELYTEEMNGGVHTFQGKEYKVVLCGLRGRIDPENVHHDEVRLHVYSMEGELLAERYLEPLTGNDVSLQLEYGPDYLIYNDGEGSGFQTKMTMPPTFFERMRAKMPRFMP